MSVSVRPVLVSQILAAVGLVWLGLIVGGFLLLSQEAHQAAPRLIIRTFFPTGSKIALQPNQLTLLLFVHPHCPCTAATFTNLEQLRVETRDRLAVNLIFTIPPGVPLGWEKGPLLSAAEAMQNVHIVIDRNGLETRRFGVLTSGHVLVYTPQGHLVFSGGITAERGHAGTSPGELAIVHLTKEPAPTDTVEKPVFGCTLL